MSASTSKSNQYQHSNQSKVQSNLTARDRKILKIFSAGLKVEKRNLPPMPALKIQDKFDSLALSLDTVMQGLLVRIFTRQRKLYGKGRSAAQLAVEDIFRELR